MRVLVVDDEPDLAGVLCRVLELSQGSACTTESALSAEGALVRLGEQPFDVLVADLGLPGMDGLELIGRAKTIQPRAGTVLITAYGSPQVEAQALALADAYLAKPFSLRHFTEVVKQVAQQNSPKETRR